MGLFSRMSTMFRGSVNDALDKIESPKVLNQYVLDTQKQLNKFEGDIKKHTTNQFRLEHEIAEEKKHIEKLDRAAEMAIEGGDEQKAKSFLNEKVSRQNKLTVLEGEYEQVLKTTGELIDSHKQLQTRLTQLRHRKDTLLRKTESAKARKRSYEIQNKVSGNDPTGDFDRLEQKVYQIEAQANAEGYVASNLHDAKKWNVSDASVDDELTRLKEKIQAKKQPANANAQNF